MVSATVAVGIVVAQAGMEAAAAKVAKAAKAEAEAAMVVSDSPEASVTVAAARLMVAR